MATDRTALLAVPAAAAMLLWPAVWNGYPIVFTDTGTYLSQAIHRYAGWDRPVFYSVFMLALHWTRTVWPVIAAQALLAAWILWLVWRVLAPTRGPSGFLALIAFLTVGTWLPWLVSELMPDLFTPLLVLALCLLAWTPDALSRTERWTLVFLATFFIATQQSSVPLSVGIVLLVGAAQAWRMRRRLRVAVPMWSGLLIPPVLAALLLCSANLLAHHRFALSPFGNVFLLA
ncbi:MAG TPA: hypothetical protein VE690_06600, partial [Rhodopila sp.]|nr:hypothetical protein [Rhodopila sp.]